MAFGSSSTMKAQQLIEHVNKHGLTPTEAGTKNGYTNLKLATKDAKLAAKLPRVHKVTIKPAKNDIPEVYLTPRTKSSSEVVRGLNHCLRDALAQKYATGKGKNKQTPNVKSTLLREDEEPATMKATLFKGVKFFNEDGDKLDVEAFKGLCFRNDLAFVPLVRFHTGWMAEDKTKGGLNAGVLAIAAVTANEEDRKANDEIESLKREREGEEGDDEDGDGEGPSKRSKISYEDLVNDS